MINIKITHKAWNARNVKFIPNDIADVYRLKYIPARYDISIGHRYEFIVIGAVDIDTKEKVVLCLFENFPWFITILPIHIAKKYLKLIDCNSKATESIVQHVKETTAYTDNLIRLV